MMCKRERSAGTCLKQISSAPVLISGQLQGSVRLYTGKANSAEGWLRNQGKDRHFENCFIGRLLTKCGDLNLKMKLIKSKGEIHLLRGSHKSYAQLYCYFAQLT